MSNIFLPSRINVRSINLSANIDISDLRAGCRCKPVWITSLSGAAADEHAGHRFYSVRMAISEFQGNFSETSTCFDILLFRGNFRHR